MMRFDENTSTDILYLAVFFPGAQLHSYRWGSIDGLQETP